MDPDDESPRPPHALPYEAAPPAADASGWISVRRKGQVLDVQFPRLCCDCLGPTDESWDVALVTAASIRVRICRSCRRRWRVRRFLLVAVPVLLFLSCVPLNRVVFPRMGGSDWIYVVTANVVFGLTAGLALLHRFGSPVRVAMVGKYAGHARIRFHNPAYARELRVNTVHAGGAVALTGFGTNAATPPKRLLPSKPARPGGAGG